MQREVLWEPWSEAGLEHLRVSFDEERLRADAVVVRAMGGAIVRLRYQLRTDETGCVRELRAVVDGAPARRLEVLADGHGGWQTADGRELRDLDGCLDLDIAATPFTNTLPIRRLRLAADESAELLVAYVSVPTLDVMPIRQRYTLLSRDADGARFLYEGLETGFRAELPVDRDGLVWDYPGVWRRRWPLPGSFRTGGERGAASSP
jgi:hypothetical protein